MDFSQKIPAYLIDKRNIVRLIFFTASFALVFINIYAPFGVTTWFDKQLSSFELLAYSSIIILTGVLVVVVSRVIMYHTNKKKIKITISQYLLWIAAEVLSMSLFYTFYEEIYINDSRTLIEVFKTSSQNTALVLLFPYSISWLYFSWIEKNKQLQELAETGEGFQGKKEMIHFKDEKGTMRISVKTVDILYLQAADNYVTIIYNTQHKQARYMLRTSLKLIDSELKNTPFIRCHRSYMVNFSKVKVIRRESDGLKLELEAETPIEIPVSKTYMNEVFKAFGHEQKL